MPCLEMENESVAAFTHTYHEGDKLHDMALHACTAWPATSPMEMNGHLAWCEENGNQASGSVSLGSFLWEQHLKMPAHLPLLGRTATLNKQQTLCRKKRNSPHLCCKTTWNKKKHTTSSCYLLSIIKQIWVVSKHFGVGWAF